MRRGGRQTREQKFLVEEQYNPHVDDDNGIYEDNEEEYIDLDDELYEVDDQYEIERKRRGSILSSPFLDHFQEEVHGLVSDYRNDVRRTFRELKDSLSPPLHNAQPTAIKHAEKQAAPQEPHQGLFVRPIDKPSKGDDVEKSRLTHYHTGLEELQNSPSRRIERVIPIDESCRYGQSRLVVNAKPMPGRDYKADGTIDTAITTNKYPPIRWESLLTSSPLLFVILLLFNLASIIMEQAAFR